MHLEGTGSYILLNSIDVWPGLALIAGMTVVILVMFDSAIPSSSARLAVRYLPVVLCLVQVGLVIIYVRRLVRIAHFNMTRQTEFDFLGFWLHAQSALGGLDFYDPRYAPTWLGNTTVSDEFRREIIDVGFWYPPPSMFFFAPLGLFERSTAFVLWHALQGVMVLASGLLLWRLFLPRAGWSGLAACFILLLACYGTASTFVFGQSTFLALAAFLAFWLASRRLSGGVWLGIATLAKPFVAIALIVPLVARRVRVMTTFFATGLIASLLSIMCFGAGTFLHYLHPTTEKPDWIYVQPTNQSLLGFTQRLFEGSCSGLECAMYAPYVLSSLIVILGTAAGLLLIARRETEREDCALGLLISCALLLYPVSQVFYSVFLVPCWLWLLTQWRRQYWAGLVVILCLVLCTIDSGRWTVAAQAITWLALLVTTVGMKGLMETRLKRSNGTDGPAIARHSR